MNWGGGGQRRWTCGWPAWSPQFPWLSQNLFLLFMRTSEASLFIAGVGLCAPGRSATITGLDSDLCSDINIIILSSAFFSALATILDVTRIGCFAYGSSQITSLFVASHVQNAFILQIIFIDSFETNSELRRIESNAFCDCPSFKSITIPCHVHHTFQIAIHFHRFRLKLIRN
jgi:hypothetical protein